MARLCAPAAGLGATKPLLRSYLTFNGGFDVLTANVSGDVVRNRFVGLVELGVGYQLSDRMVLDVTYGWLGKYEVPYRALLIPDELDLSDGQRTFRVSVNPLMFRLHYAHSGQRTEYAKPELTFGLGFFQVTRFLRNVAFIPPEERSQLLPAAEVGLTVLFVFTRNFCGYAGGRFDATSRASIADDTRHLDGFSTLIGFRIFLPSPRDVEGP